MNKKIIIALILAGFLSLSNTLKSEEEQPEIDYIVDDEISKIIESSTQDDETEVVDFNVNQQEQTDKEKILDVLEEDPEQFYGSEDSETSSE